jgi:nucleoside-diphosphate-sugar epimerase
VPAETRAAIEGCSQVVHLAAAEHASAEHDGSPFTVIERDVSVALAMIRAALDLDIERFVYVSSARVFERAEQFPTPEDHLAQCPAAVSASAFAALSGERACRAAYAERGFRFTICRPFDAYGAAPAAPAAPAGDEAASELDGLLGELAHGASGRRQRLELAVDGQQTRTPTHVDDIADGLLLALGSPKAVGEDFNLGGAEELTVGEILRVAWQACDGEPDALSLKKPRRGSRRGPERSAASTQKARLLLGWEATVEARSGISASARRLLEASASAALA